MKEWDLKAQEYDTISYLETGRVELACVMNHAAAELILEDAEEVFNLCLSEQLWELYERASKVISTEFTKNKKIA
jgi:hypothetical protein